MVKLLVWPRYLLKSGKQADSTKFYLRFAMIPYYIEGRKSQEWSIIGIVPIPKKGDL